MTSQFWLYNSLRSEVVIQIAIELFCNKMHIIKCTLKYIKKFLIWQNIFILRPIDDGKQWCGHEDAASEHTQRLNSSVARWIFYTHMELEGQPCFEQKYWSATNQPCLWQNPRGGELTLSWTDADRRLYLRCKAKRGLFYIGVKHETLLKVVWTSQ